MGQSLRPTQAHAGILSEQKARREGEFAVLVTALDEFGVGQESQRKNCEKWYGMAQRLCADRPGHLLSEAVQCYCMRKCVQASTSRSRQWVASSAATRE
jgi:hypothetical protein